MRTKMLKKARELFAVEIAPRHIQRHNMRAWVRSVRLLGSKWLLAEHVERKA